MKKATLLFIILIFSQVMTAQENKETYEDLWKKVQQFDEENLPKSALNIIAIISEKAKNEKNSPQLIKSLLHRSKYALTLEDDAQLNIINDFKIEIQKAESPTKNILQSYLANLYWQYFQENRYQFYNRTETAEKVDSTDFRTWDLTTLFHEINTHFDASLQNCSSLQKIKVSEFDFILSQQKGSEKFRPTLYDLIAHTALNFYKTSENSITRPAVKFEIDTAELLCEGYQFTAKKIETSDKTSLQAKALQMYQDLLKFHANDASLDAYTVIDIERLQFIKENATFENKELHYVEILKNSAESMKNNANWGLYQHEIASEYQQWGNQYQPNVNKEYRWKLKEALELSESKKGSVLKEKLEETDFGNIQIRKNLQETAFYFPQLKTDEAENISFNFTTPEALTKWKLQLVAHTKNLQGATKTLESFTQKELMATPNLPWFLIEGGKIIISSKIANLTEKVF
jgi:hypothetical protein